MPRNRRPIVAVTVVEKAIRIHAPFTSQLFVFGRVSRVRNFIGRVRSSTSRKVVMVTNTSASTSGR